MAELLAPAGSLDHVLSAIDAGADAVYLGGKSFNARKFAHNLSDEELAEAVRIAHVFGVKIYVTVNIIMADKELKELERYLAYLDAIAVDGIIVQDLAVAAMARKVAPGLPLHGSTQMTVADIEGVRFLEKLGFTQAVLAREVSLDEIRSICSQTDMAIEVFVHGASCVSYSGQCLMSSFIGGRSGNRGACAQPCRLPYTLLQDGAALGKGEAYLLSLKDLNGLSHIHDLLDAGVASFKIEGRIKGTEYVHTVVEAYRQVIDSHYGPARERQAALERGRLLTAESFNRTYQDDFLTRSVGRQTITERSGGNQGRRVGTLLSCRGSDGEAVLEEPLAAGDTIKILAADGQEYIDEVQDAAGSFTDKRRYTLKLRRSDLPAGTIYRLARREDRKGRGKGLQRRIPLYAHVDTDDEEKVRLTLWDEQGHSAEITSDYTAVKAQKRPATAVWIREQLDRLGGTPFSLADATIWDETHMIPASVVNTLRRQVADAMYEEILAEYKRPLPGAAAAETAEPVLYPAGELAVSVRCDSVDAVRAAVKGGAKRVIFGGESYGHKLFSAADWQKALAAAHNDGASLWAATPRVIMERHSRAVYAELEQALQCGADGVYAGSMSVFSMLRRLGRDIPVYADWSLNIFNSCAAGEYIRLGCSGITASTEATLKQVGRMTEICPVEILAQGRLEMMVTEYCAVAAFAGKGTKNNCPAPCAGRAYSLEDRKQEQFPIVTDQYCHMHILNGKELDMRPYFSDIKRSGVSLVRLEGRGRSPEWIETMTRQYVRLCSGAETMLFGKENDGVTRGHFFRGIL